MGLKKQVASGKLLGEPNHCKGGACRERNDPQGRVYYRTSFVPSFRVEQGEVEACIQHGVGPEAPETQHGCRGDLLVLQQEIMLAKRRFRLPEAVPVRSCYEAGRDGFWLHRYLLETKTENLVVDSSSIEVDRRAKRAKTDRIDVGKLLNMLILVF